MNPTFAQTCLFLTAMIGLAAAQETEIHCTDGSRIRGSMQGIETDRIIFDADFLAAPVPLRLDKVLELSLPVHHHEGEGDHVATITLSNGDELRGELTGIDKESITLDTWYAGELTFRRSMVDSLDIKDRPRLIFGGPTSLEEWTQTNGDSWSYANGSLRASGSGSIALDLKLPSKSRFAFDLAWRSTPRFQFLFHSNDVKSSHPDNCYQLLCHGRSVQLNKRWSNDNQSGNSSLGGFTNIPEFLSKEKCRLELLVDRTTGRIRLLVNDRIAADWIDPEPDAGNLGGGIHFDSPDGAPLRISRIEVTTWDGILEGRGPEHEEDMIGEDDAPRPDAESPADPTRIRLRNNDQVAGEVQGIKDGKVNLLTPFGEVALPVSRLRTFMLHTQEERENWELGRYEIPKIYNGDVRAWFPDGGRVTFRLESVVDGKLKGAAQPFGTAAFDQKAFSRIEFNLYEPEFDDLRDRRDAF